MIKNGKKFKRVMIFLDYYSHFTSF